MNQAPLAATALLDWHTNFAWVVVVANGLAGAWVLAANWVEPLRVRPMWWFVVVAELTIFVQVALGVGLVAIEDLFHSTARLVGHPLAMRLDQGELREIVDAMRDASVGVGAPA